MAVPAPEPDIEPMLFRIRSGDRAAFAALLRQSMPQLQHYIGRQFPGYLRSHVDESDVLQEVYLEAFRRIQQFQATDASSVRRWLNTIARHRIVDLVRAHNALKRGGAHRSQQLASTPMTEKRPRCFRVWRSTSALRVSQQCRASNIWRFSVHLKRYDRSIAKCSTFGTSAIARSVRSRGK